MKDILQELNMAVGVMGSMVVTKDGILAAAELGKELNSDAVAALACNFVINTTRHLEQVERDAFQLFILKATNGKLVLMDCGTAYLVVVANRRIQLNLTIIDLRKAALKLKKELDF